ncbi:peptide ABC transporter permease [Sutcliffiella horikoshii]|uniref:peptide ABC transporter permease n=1 Tax=Sutcliffiella horikoshii TaxID=79883 RepID=UPI00384A58AD
MEAKKRGILLVILGTSMLVFMLALSFFPMILLSPEDTVTKRLMYDENGNIMGVAPFSPKESPPLGTNKLGENLLYLIISGAKYTILFVLVASLVRTMISFILGSILSFYNQKISFRFSSIIPQAFYFFPQALFVYIIMMSLDTQSIGYLFIQFSLIVMIGVLPNATLFSYELKEELNKDYIKILRVSRISKLHIFRKHLFSFIKERMILHLLNNNLQLIVLLIHLGVLGVFIGGSIVIPIESGITKSFSITNEWSGLIGADFRSISYTPWIAIAPLIGFSLFFISINIILKGSKLLLYRR